MEIEFGALSKPLFVQFGYNDKNVKKWQKLADAIVILSIHGIISDSEKGKARRRLVKMMEAKNE
jgi:hypothetical protein